MAEALISAGGVAAIVALAWFFFGARRAHAAEFAGDRQQVKIAVKGGYSPKLIRARAGVPLQLIFDRQETGDCTSRRLPRLRRRPSRSGRRPARDLDRRPAEGQISIEEYEQRKKTLSATSP